MNQIIEMNKEGKEVNDMMQKVKCPNNQADINNMIKDEDALYKFLAFSAMIEKERYEHWDKADEIKAAYDIHTFDKYYLKTLYNDSFREPRQINPDDFKPKNIHQIQGTKGFRTNKEREQDYWKEFEIF